MAIDVYLQIDGIKGESADSAHPGWLECLSVNWKLNQPKSATSSTAGGHTAERVGLRGLRVMWIYRHGMRWCLEANLGPDPLPAPSGTLSAITTLSHRWQGNAPGAQPAWAPWSARWTWLPAQP